MTELRFVSREAMYLTLESVSGERFQVLIDDALREAIRRGNQEVMGVSPRLIQQRIREGASIAELASETGESEDSISVFALPVLDELRYVLATAKAIELADENRMVAFGLLAEERLGALNWSIRKSAQGWLISAIGQYGTAEWRYEPKTRQLEPLNDTARAIQSSDSHDLIRATVPVPKRPVQKAPPKPPVQREAVPPISDQQESADGRDDMTGSSRGASVLDLVEELRSRRARDNQSETAETPNPAPANPSAPLAKPAAKGRTSLPSWDEIVLGTATSEPDSD
jgi:hypothetical protein